MKITISAKNFHNIKCLDFGNIKSDITVNSIYYMKDGNPKLFTAGEFHFERYPREFWEDEILKMKAGGIDVISAYITWLFHEQHKSDYCFDGDFDDGAFLALCKKHDMGVIMRIGPYVHGELRHGGLPDFVFNLPYNRSDNPKYIALVKEYWQRLYENTKNYYDGKTVVGIQLENEYVKGFDHLLTLRKLAEEIGFKVPIFTVTGWGFTFDNNDLQGTYGGYPARPWAQHKHRMPVQGNFTIRSSYNDCGIGDDSIDYSGDKPTRMSEQPNFTCECGCGNQVTEHRREIISTNDAYGVPFATLANGCNWMGYYMYHGSDNPRGGLYQESRITFSPNNCPVIDYDFQAPLGRFGYPRESYKRLKSLNYFAQYYGDRLAPMQRFYSEQLKITEETDAVTPRLDIRMNKNGSGFLFASTYEREQKMPPLKNVEVTVETEKGNIQLPSFSVAADEFLLFPFNIQLGTVEYKYIFASPVAHIKKDGITTHFFRQTAHLSPEYEINGKMGIFEISDTPKLKYNAIDDKTRLVVMTEKLSDDFYIIGGKTVFSNAVVYGEQEITIEYKKGDYCTVDGKKISLDVPEVAGGARLRKRKAFHGKYSRYLFSPGKRGYYDFSSDNLVFNDKIVDYLVDFDFEGSTLQMYYGKELVNDFFNIDGNHTMSLKYYKPELKNGNLSVVTAPFSPMRKIYTEKEFKQNNSSLRAARITPIYRKIIK